MVIENLPEDHEEMLEAINHPEHPDLGTRPLAFGREIYIEQDDFMEDPPKKFFRLKPGGEYVYATLTFSNASRSSRMRRGM